MNDTIVNANSFYRELEFTDSNDPIIQKILRAEFGKRNDITITKNSTEKEDFGIDYIIASKLGSVINVDSKVRKWAFSNSEDIVLETISNIGTGKIGWSLDDSKLTDIVLWYWLTDNVYYFAKFKDILAVTKKHKDEWLSKYRRVQNTWVNGSVAYQSESIFLPLKIYEKAVKDYFWDNL